MSNTTKTETPSIDDVEREILASDLAPQVRIWMLAMIAQMRLTEQHRINSIVDFKQRLAGHASVSVVRRVEQLEEELKGAIAGIEAMTTAIEGALSQHLAPLQKLESVLGKMDGLGETIEWMKGARAGIERAITFLAPAITDTAPPFDGAQIVTRAMLDKQLALLSRSLHETINRVRSDVGARLIELGEAVAARVTPEALRPRALLVSWLRRGK